MNLYHIAYFKQVCDENSFTEASKLLHVSPQTITKAVDGIEKELGVKLLIRDRKSVHLTSFGHLFYERAQSILDEVSFLKEMAEGYNSASTESGSIVIGIASVPEFGISFDESIISAAKNKCPKIHVSEILLSNSACALALDEELVDAALVVGRIERDGIVNLKLNETRMKAVISKKHPLLSKNSLTITDLNKQIIGCQFDMKYFFNSVKRLCEAFCIEAIFVDVEPNKQKQISFLANGGMLFLAEDALNNFHDSACKSFTDESMLNAPLCVSFKKGNRDVSLGKVIQTIIANKRSSIYRLKK